MKNVITAIQSLLKNAIVQSNSPLAWVKRVYFWDPRTIPSGSLPALTIQPISSDYIRRGSVYDQKVRTIEIRLVVNQKDYFDSNIGATVALTGAVYSNSQITFTSANHWLVADDEVQIESANPSTFNGTYKIVSATTNNFVVAKQSNPGIYVNSWTWKRIAVETVGMVEQVIEQVESSDFDHETAAYSVCGVIQKNPTLPFTDENGTARKASQDAKVRSVNYWFSDVRWFPTFEVTTTVEVTEIGDR